MSRAITVILLAALCAALFGVDESSWAAQNDAAREAARREAVGARVTKIKVGSVVKVERIDGRKIEGMLTAKTPTSITVNVYQRRAFRRPRLVGTDTIPLDDLKEIKKPLSGAQIALITTGAVVGTCTIITVAALGSQSTTQPLQEDPSTTSEQAPTSSGTEEPSTNHQETLITR